MPWLLLGFALLVVGLLVLRWLATAEPSKLVRQVQVGGSLILIIAAVALGLTGRIGLALPLGMAAIGFIAPRRFGGTRKAGPKAGPKQGRTGSTAPTRGGMSQAEARDVLGLKPGASESDIREAHRRLIIKMHPDQGGSDYLAARINEAKDVLLGRHR